MKKIVEFIGAITDGGAETIVKDYALNLNKNKFEILILTLDDPDYRSANYNILWNNKIKITTVFSEKRTFIIKIFEHLLRIIFKDKYTSYKIKRILLREKPDVIHVHLELLHFLVKPLKKIKLVKLFYTCHGEPYRYFSGKNEREFFAAKKLIVHNNLQIIALHEEMAQELNDLLGIQDTIVVRNCVSSSKFKDICMTKSEAKVRLGIPSNYYVIGHVGRFTKLKNHKLILETFKIMRNKNKNVFLLLVGTGELKNDIENFLSKNGLDNCSKILVNRDDIPIIMRAMDAFIFPSLSEGLGIALIEAQISGLFCVVSDKIPRAAIVSKNVYIENLESSPLVWSNDLENMKSNIDFRVTELDEYDIENVITRISSLYEGVLK